MAERQRLVNSPEGDLGPFVADVLELAGRFRRAADEIARQEGETQARWYALSVFSGAPLTVSQAARRLGTSRQAVQRTANELLNRGLAVTEPNPDHRAAPFLVLTEKGRETLERISRAAEAWRRERLPDDDPPQLAAARAEVTALLGRLRDGPA